MNLIDDAEKQKRKEIKRKHYLKNKETILIKAKQYREANKEQVKIRSKISQKKYNDANKEKIKLKRDNNKENAKKYRDVYREANKEVLASKEKKRQESEEYKIKRKLYSQTLNGKYNTYKRTAKQRNIEFELTLEEFSLLWKVDCVYCGDKIDTIGLDRIDSTKSYNLDNIVSCCSICNYMKLNHSKDKFLSHIKKIYNYNGEYYEFASTL